MDGISGNIAVTVNHTPAVSSVNNINRALDSLVARGRTVSAANDNTTGSITRLGQSMAGTAGHGGAVSKVLDDIRGRAAGATPAIGGLVQSLMSMGPVAAIIGGVALGLGAIGAASIKAAAQTQGWNAQIETITKNSDKAKSTYAGLVAFGNSTPFDTGQSVQAFVKLRQMGLAATEDRLRSFGNTASASGKSLNQMIEAVADAGTGEFERLKEFGIKSKTEGDKVKFTMAGVTTTVANNSVAITKYLEDIGNTKFAGAMAKQMDTLNGAFSNVQDSMRGMFSAIGEGALGTAVKEIAKSIASGISLITPFMSSIGNAIGGIINGVGSVLNGLGSLWAGFGGASNAMSLMEGITVTMNLIGQGAQVLGSAIGSVFGFIGNIVSSVASMWRSSFGSLLGDLTSGFDAGGRSWANSIVGILRAVKYVVGEMPKMFKVAVADIMRSFRDMGAGIMAFLSGDWKKGIELFKKPQLVSTQKIANAVGRNAYHVYKDEKGADAAIGRLRGKTVAPKIDAGFDTKPDKSGGKSKGGDGKSEAQKLAEKIDDFWKKLDGESKDAQTLYETLGKAASEGRNLSTASAEVSKALEFQRLAGRAITDQERERINNALQQGRNAKLLTDELLAADKRHNDLATSDAIIAARRTGMSDEQLSIEKAILEWRAKQIAGGATEVDLRGAAFSAAEAALRVDTAHAIANERTNKALDDQKAALLEMARAGSDYANTALRDNGAVDQRRAIARKEYDERIKGLKAAKASTDPKVAISSEAFEAGSKRAGEELQDRFRDIGTEFANRMSSVSNLLDSVGDIIGGPLGKLLGTGSEIAKGIGNFEATQTDIGRQFATVFGKNSDLVKGIGDKVGGLMAGLQIGEKIGQLGKALGLKGSETGAKIGGALGGLTGNPFIAAAASLVGGLVSSLFYKPKYGTASLTGPGASVVSGNNGTAKGSATGAAGSVQDGLAKLAAELGGAVGNYSVAIGQYDGKWRVRDDAYNGALKFKGASQNGLHDFGKDGEAEAIAYAIKNAVADGAITGLSSLIQKALKGLGSDAAIQFAKDWTAAMSDYKSIIDPVGSAIDGVIKPLDALKATMVRVGASAEDMGKFEAYRAVKLNSALKEQVSGFQDILDGLNGDVGGVSDFKQLQNKLAELATMRESISAGKQVDQSAYTSLANTITSKLGSVYGTNTQEYQNGITLVRATTEAAMGNVTSAFNAVGGNASVVSAVQAQTESTLAVQQATLTTQQATLNATNTTNELLTKLLAQGASNGGPTLTSVNARVALAYQ